MLTWKVLTVKRRGLTRDVPPGTEDLEWVANSSTLVSGERDAVLVDAFMTIDQARTQVDWVAASGKNLVAIYLTHAHGEGAAGCAPLRAVQTSGLPVRRRGLQLPGTRGERRR